MERKRIPIPVSYALNIVLVALFLFFGQKLMDSGLVLRAQSTVILQIGVYIILAVSLNISTGYLGQLPLGHAGFMAVGAYAAAIFWKSKLFEQDLPMILLGLLIAGIVAAIFGIMIGIPALRLKGDYLAIITLGFGEIIRIIINNTAKLTGGAAGLRNVPKYSNFMLIYICVALTCTFIHMMMKSRHGRAILSIRENEIAAESCGIKTTYYKVLAFAVSAFFAGIAGALYGGIQGTLSPEKFGFMNSIDILVMVVLGGMGSMLGSALAAAILTALPLILQQFNEYRMIIYPTILILVMIFKPSGLMGTYDFSLTRILEKIFFRQKKEVTTGGEKK